MNITIFTSFQVLRQIYTQGLSTQLTRTKLKVCQDLYVQAVVNQLGRQECSVCIHNIDHSSYRSRKKGNTKIALGLGMQLLSVFSKSWLLYPVSLTFQLSKYT